MTMRKSEIGHALVSGLCVGGNPFGGYSHQSKKRSREMIQYYTPERIKKTLRTAEQAGINTFFGRTDNHTIGIISDYRQKGGTIQWFAQVSPERDDPESWRKWLKAAIKLGATGAYLHGGVVDFWYANNMTGHFHEALAMMRESGVVAGFAGHKPDAHAWIRDHLDVDFQMCSYYNPTDRSKSAHHIAVGEKWHDEDRARMLKIIASINRPVVHYKVFAGGNKPVVAAFELLGKVMRPNDVVVVGVFTKDKSDMIEEDVALFKKHVEAVQKAVTNRQSKS